MTTAAPARFYFEDLVIGTVMETPGMTLTEAHVGLYQGLSGETEAERGTVPGLLPLCLTTGLGWRAPQPPLVVLAFLGIEWEVLRTLHVGDTIRSRSRVATKRPMRDGGLVIEEREVLDQHGQLAHRGRFTFLVARRPPEETAP